nr:MAG: Pyridoxal-phosphate dependent enzyme [Bacteriophage sp.]
MNEYSLTPVQEVDGLRIKRDDLYAPFGPGEVNGGKLRQCVMLVNSVKKDYKSLLTYCSIHSPQAPITAAVARANGMPCRIVYGGTTRESVAALPMPRLAMKYGASIVLAARSGRHSILHARAKELAAQENSFIVQYGINIIGYGDTLLTAVAAQTENLPDDYRKPRDDLRQRNHRHRRDDRTAQVRETGQEDAPRSHGPGPARIHP